MTKKSFLHLLTKEIGGNISADERQLLQNELQENDIFRRVHTEIHRFMTSDSDRSGIDVDEKLEEVWNRINAGEKIVEITPPVRKMRLWMWTKVAATVALFVGLGWMTFSLLPSDNLYSETIVADAYNRYVMLDDGTQVWLNAHSEIAYNKNFGKDNRKIKLTGQAFFDVAHLPEVPLTVTANDVDVMVKGTAFNVNALQSDVEIALLRGLVAVRDKRQKDASEILLHPHQKIRMGQNIEATTIRTITQMNDTIINETQWMNNTLVFKKEKLENIAKLLENRFGVKIEIQTTALREQRFTGVIRDQSLEEIIEALKQSFPFAYEIKNTNIIIK